MLVPETIMEATTVATAAVDEISLVVDGTTVLFELSQGARTHWVIRSLSI